ncbi:dihydrolipoyl dehydrogenase [Maritimibacter sp. DP07]|jgi:dihydrolipoamide dehydrogenase|uniref:Dihydrolipoyl dehydrogenase n=1 Tax=Maritimibacter harenae TaxID=2606218 RepID=A0A845M3W7_9RHOB|nr:MULTISPECIES: dihydrolipoyl dehydrogenase [Maritimibacter]MBL6430243.1 dihydrolipoyl dehydrogenase [Maritimibacter sp.]MZR13689.1 dihydrolipoyl dehydrogenase [Maritimibacter harenae]
MNEVNTSLLVIGGGPGGYVCAARAARLGVDTLLVEKDRLGGTCLNVGCIPSKALIHAAGKYATALSQAEGGTCGVSVADPVLDFAKTRRWMDEVTGKLRSGVTGMMEQHGVKTMQGVARFRDGKTVEVTGETGTTLVRADHVVIATGSRPVELPGLPTGGKVLDSTAALALNDVPDRIAVIGAGYIGLELGTAFAKLGAQVTLIEAADALLPQYDRRLTSSVVKRLGALGVTLMTDTRVTGWDEGGGTLDLEGARGKSALEVDNVLVTVGRTANTDGLGLEELQLRMTGAFIRIDDECRTSMRGVYAIGDVTAGPMLAHRATAQAEVVADIVAGHPAAWDKSCVPAVCFTDPEIVSVGLLPDEPEGAVENSEFSFRANGRALSLEDAEGFVRVIARREDHVVLGVQATGPGVSELAAGFAIAIEAGLRVEDVAATIHPHPTLSEAFQESALGLASFPNHR